MNTRFRSENIRYRRKTVVDAGTNNKCTKRKEEMERCLLTLDTTGPIIYVQLSGSVQTTMDILQITYVRKLNHLVFTKISSPSDKFGQPGEQYRIDGNLYAQGKPNISLQERPSLSSDSYF